MNSTRKGTSNVSLGETQKNRGLKLTPFASVDPLGAGYGYILAFSIGIRVKASVNRSIASSRWR